MSDSEHSTEDIGEQVARAFAMPKHNATIPELMAALKASNKAGNALLVENKRLQMIVDKHEASKSGRKTKNKNTAVKGEDTLGYHSHIISLGKSYGLLVDPWLSPVVFSKKVNHPVAVAENIFKDEKSDLYQQYLTAMLYARIPEKFHRLVDRAVYSDFSVNFLHNLNAGRSSAISTIKTRLPHLLIEENVIEKMDAANLLSLLLHPADNTKNTEKKVSKFPPILYPHNRLDKGKIFLNRLPMLVHRMILFGPTSVNNHGKQKPQSSTLGVMWGLQRVTSGSVAFSVTATVYVIYWLLQGLTDPGAKEEFFEVGSVSKINFRRLFMRLLLVLKSAADTPGIKRAMRAWDQTVFYGITTATPTERTGPAGDVSLEDFEDVMAGLQQVILSDTEYAFGDEKADSEDADISDIGAALAAVAPPRTAPSVSRSAAPPPPIIRRPTSRPVPNAEEEEADDLNVALAHVAPPKAAPAARPVRPVRPSTPPPGQPILRQSTSRQSKDQSTSRQSKDQSTSRPAPEKNRVGDSEYYDWDSGDEEEPISAPRRPVGRRTVHFLIPEPQSSDLSASEGSGIGATSTAEPVNRPGRTTGRPTVVPSEDNGDGLEMEDVEPTTEKTKTRKAPAGKGKTKQTPKAAGVDEEAQPVQAQGRRRATPPVPPTAAVDLAIGLTEVSERPRRSTRRG